MEKNAFITISFLLAAILVMPAACAQDAVLTNPPSASGNPVFRTPNGIAVDSAGNIYVIDNNNYTVWKFSPSGNVITYWGSEGSGKGQFEKLESIAIDDQNFIYITDNMNNRVQKFSSDGVYISHGDFLADNGTGYSPPTESSRNTSHWICGIAVGADGNLYIVDKGHNSIYKTTPDGKILAKWGSQGYGDGQFNQADRIAVDREGNFFVTDNVNNRVQKFSANGTFLISWGSEGTDDGQFSSPGGIGVDRNGFVYIADANNNRVQKFTGSGIFVTRWGSWGSNDGEFRGPYDVAADSNDNIYVADFFNHRVQKFTSDGKFIMKWGGSSQTAHKTSSSPGFRFFPVIGAVVLAWLVVVRRR